MAAVLSAQQSQQSGKRLLDLAGGQPPVSMRPVLFAAADGFLVADRRDLREGDRN